ncbi:MAG: recombinase family protein [Flavobacteriaceae bacterium]
MKKDIGIWIRVSTADSAKGESPITHKERAQSYAEFQGWNVKEVYNLSGISGKSVVNHPEAQRMQYDIQRGHIKALVFSKIARFARNTRELMDFADFFKKHDADMVSIQESIDTSTPSGRLFFRHLASMAEWEREEIVDRVNSSIKIRAKKGKRLGGKVPYGYNWDGHILTINKEEAVVRKLVFELFLKEKRKKTVARILNERGYKPRNGKHFYDTNIKRWIRDPLSKGLRRSNHTKKTHVDGKTHAEPKPKEEWFFHEAPAIVSEEVWQKANDILDEQEKQRGQPLNKKLHIFTKYIFCECDSRMTVRSGNKFYRCTSCKNKIEREILEDIFREQLTNYVSSEDKVREYLKLSESGIGEKQQLLNTNITKRDELKKKIDKIIALHVDDKITKEAFKEYHDPLYGELTLVKQEVVALESEIKSRTIQQESVNLVIDDAVSLYANWNNFNRDEKRRLVEMITERITIGKDDQIHIKLYRLMPQRHFSELETNGQRNLFL